MTRSNLTANVDSRGEISWSCKHVASIHTEPVGGYSLFSRCWVESSYSFRGWRLFQNVSLWKLYFVRGKIATPLYASRRNQFRFHVAYSRKTEVYHLKRQPRSHVLWCKTETRSRYTCNVLSQPPSDTRIKVTLVARSLLTPFGQNPCRWECGVSTDRKRVDFRSLVIVCGCLWSGQRCVTCPGTTRWENNTSGNERKCVSVISAYRETKWLKLWLYLF